MVMGDDIFIMTERFDLSFKNKEVRMWLYIMVPTFIIGSLLLLFGDFKDQYIRFGLLVIAIIFFYVWRYLYRRKQTKKHPKYIK